MGMNIKIYLTLFAVMLTVAGCGNATKDAVRKKAVYYCELRIARDYSELANLVSPIVIKIHGKAIEKSGEAARILWIDSIKTIYEAKYPSPITNNVSSISELSTDYKHDGGLYFVPGLMSGFTIDSVRELDESTHCVDITASFVGHNDSFKGSIIVIKEGNKFFISPAKKDELQELLNGIGASQK